MGYPDWKAFAYIFGAKSNDAFEALARNLFKKRYGIGDTLSYFKNHPGNETDVIKVGKDYITTTDMIQEWFEENKGKTINY